MKKILFIGNYRNSSGWGKAAIDYIKALLTIPEADLTIRPVYLDGSVVQHIDLELQYLEQKTSDSYDVVIQKILPHLCYYDGRCGKNVVLTVVETGGFQYSGWKSKLDIMDLVLTPDHFGSKYLSEITKTPVDHVSEPIDVDSLLTSDEIYKLDDINQSGFKFLFCGEHNDRKNLNLLIQAYLTEFSKLDNVYLIIKTSKAGEHPSKTIQGIVDSINNFKFQKLRKYMGADLYPVIQIIADHINDMGALYRAVDCMVMPSRGECFARPVAEAMVCGIPAIVTNNIGITDYVNSNNGWLIDSVRVPCSSKHPPLPEYYTSREFWMEPSINSLRKCLREAYEDRELLAKKSEQARKIKDLVNYQTVGENIWRKIS